MKIKKALSYNEAKKWYINILLLHKSKKGYNFLSTIGGRIYRFEHEGDDFHITDIKNPEFTLDDYAYENSDIIGLKTFLEMIFGFNEELDNK